MEEDQDNSNQSDITNGYSRNRKHTQVKSFSKSSSLTDSTFADQLFWYDIQNLPDLLLIEILARLPLKSVFRVKCVSKNWHTLISHPSFRKFYSLIPNSSSSSLLPFEILYRYVYVSNFKQVADRLCLETYGSSRFSGVRFLSSLNEQNFNRQFKILSISNGLILFGSFPSVYYVCDPVTGQCVNLPRGRRREYIGEGLVSRINQDNNMVTSFKVVRVGYDYLSKYLYLETFSSNTGKWVSNKLPCTNHIKLRYRRGCPINCNGILHWLVHDKGMVAFDPYKDRKSCRLIKFPDDRDLKSEDDGIYRLCDECQGNLRYFEVTNESSKFYCFRMWVMKDYEKGEWRCEFKVTRSDLHSSDKQLRKASFLPLSFNPLDLNFVYLKCKELGYIVSYDVRNKRLDIVSKSSSDQDLSCPVVVSFVLPRWPICFSRISIPKDN